MSRSYSELASEKTRLYLEKLSNKSSSSQEYGDALFELGKELGSNIKAMFPNDDFYLVCTNEDADYLAKGILDNFNSEPEKIALSCYWNNRETLLSEADYSIKTAPIIKKYEEPTFKRSILIVLKSIISSGCVVKHSILSAYEKVHPQKILIVAPVIYKKSEPELESEFHTDISDKFEFLFFAKDDSKDEDGNIFPGIGGNVYTRLGFKDQGDKNTYIPDIVKSRRRELFSV